MPNNQKLTEQEWSHFFDIDDLDKHSATQLTINASEEECTDLARRFAMEVIRDVEAKLSLSRDDGGNVIHVQGEFSCVITQNCVVSLEPFDTELLEPVEGWFADKDSAVSFVAAKKEREVKRTHGEVEITEEKDDLLIRIRMGLLTKMVMTKFKLMKSPLCVKTLSKP